MHRLPTALAALPGMVSDFLFRWLFCSSFHYRPMAFLILGLVQTPQRRCCCYRRAPCFAQTKRGKVFAPSTIALSSGHDVEELLDCAERLSFVPEAPRMRESRSITAWN